MSCKRTLQRFTTLLIALIFLSVSGITYPQDCEITISMPDVYVAPGIGSTWLPIYLQNDIDSIAGFEIWLMLNRPDIACFALDTVTIVDSTYWRCLEYVGTDCIDSLDVTDSVYLDPESEYDWVTTDLIETISGILDTNGTLVQGWDYLSARNIGGMYDIKLTGISDIGDPNYPHEIDPQDGSVPLIWVKMAAKNVLDTLQDRTAEISVQDIPDHFSFADKYGNVLGLITDTVIDTSCFTCDSWEGDICLSWSPISCDQTGLVDSIAVDTGYVPTYDPGYFCLVTGSITAKDSNFCADANNDGLINLLDISKIIECQYYPPIEGCELSDVDPNNDDAFNLLDIVYIIGYLYKEGPAPWCMVD